MSESKPRAWWIDVNEWLDERERCQSGMAFTQGWLDEMEMTTNKMIPVIERSAYAAVVRERDELRNRHPHNFVHKQMFKQVTEERDQALELLRAATAALEKISDYQAINGDTWPADIADVALTRIRESKLLGDTKT